MINVIVDVVAAIHSVIAAIEMSRAVIPKEILPIDTAYGGKLKYLTFWNIVSSDDTLLGFVLVEQ